MIMAWGSRNHHDDEEKVAPSETSPLLLSTLSSSSEQETSGNTKTRRTCSDDHHQQQQRSHKQQLLFLDELQEQWRIAFPTLQSLVLTKIPWLISIRFAGALGERELAAAALATTLCNVTGLSLSVGLSFALTTLAGQAKGELQSRQNSTSQIVTSVDEENSPASSNDTTTTTDTTTITPLVYLYRGMTIQLAMVIPVGISWLFGVEHLLIQLGQSHQLAQMTDVYLRILVPSLWCYSISWTLTAWVQSIGMADVPVYAAILGLICHVPFNWLFVQRWDYGYLGCAWATVCFQFIQATVIGGYLFGTRHGRDRVMESTGATAMGTVTLPFWPEFVEAVSSFRGVMQYIGLALPGIVIISEWWASEAAIFLSGRLIPHPEAAVGGMTIYQSINAFCFMFPVSFATAASTRVSNLLGAGQPLAASFAGKVSIASAAVLSLALGLLLMYGIPHTFLPSLFAPGQDEVILQTSRTMPLLAVYVFADGIQVALNGIIRGCGRQWVTTPIVVVAYWVVGVPLAYYMAFIRHDQQSLCDDSYFCGDVGLVFGMTTGTWVHMALLAIVVCLTTNWNLEAKKARERVTAAKNR